MMNENLKKIENRIAFACEKWGRKRSEIQLIWVSKTKPVDAILKAIELGATHFGENRVQEALEKFPDLLNIHSELCLHIIGPIQSNKLRKAVGIAHWIHSVEDLKQVQRIDELAQEMKRPIQILFQVNTSLEDSKSGLNPENLEDFLSLLPQSEWVKYRGLMTIGPNSGVAEDARKGFKWLKEMQLKWFNKDLRFKEFDVLSMGMSADLEIAIECGSTHLRIGSALFGGR